MTIESLIEWLTALSHLPSEKSAALSPQEAAAILDRINRLKEAEAALTYIYGTSDTYEGWGIMVKDKLTPPLPRPEHLRAQGLIHKSEK